MDKSMEKLWDLMMGGISQVLKNTLYETRKQWQLEENEWEHVTRSKQLGIREIEQTINQKNQSNGKEIVGKAGKESLRNFSEGGSVSGLIPLGQN